jgi:molybdopterin/thiamine biosynthesis adenylyltransferase
VIRVDTARVVAEEELTALGFRRRDGSDLWEGRLGETEWQDLKLFVALPPRFPHELPQISVDRAALPRPLPHIEASGKVCIVATTGLLVDPSLPRSIVQEAVGRARATIGKGLRGQNEPEFYEEFAAYWAPNGRHIISFCEVHGSPRVIAIGTLTPRHSSPLFVAAETATRLRVLADRMRWEISHIDTAYFLPLQSPIAPPPFEEDVTFAFLGRVIRDHVAPIHVAAIARWRASGQQNATFLLSFHIDDLRGDAVFALRLTGQLSKVVRGFRVGKVPLQVAIGLKASARAERLATQRADMEFLRMRTGSTRDFTSKKVLVVGCGAIGGYLSTALTDSGVGQLTLVDSDSLKSENAMRHVLGLSAVGSRKVDALRAFLQQRLPHVEIRAYPESIEQVLEREPFLARSHDVVVFATGDQTLELRVGEALRREARLIHTWIEAEGVGGHVLVDGHSSKGCLGCLFETDEVLGLYCRASLCAPGQTFTSSVAGCAGTFTAFGSMDAQRAGIEAARATLRVLSGDLTRSTLITWYESSGPFDSGALLPSDRARSLECGARIELVEHAQGCLRCA